MAANDSASDDTPYQHHRRGSSQQRLQQQHQHLIQSPYKVPVLPQLHSSEETAHGSKDRPFRSPIPSHLPHTPSSLKSPGSQPSISAPIPLKQWPYVQPTHPSHPWDPQALHANTETSSHSAAEHTGAAFDPRMRQHSQSPAVIHDPRHGSTSTTDSSSAGREDEVKDKKKPSKLTAKVKAKMKDFFARDEYDEPVTASRRRRSNPWEDEDY